MPRKTRIEMVGKWKLRRDDRDSRERLAELRQVLRREAARRSAGPADAVDSTGDRAR